MISKWIKRVEKTKDSLIINGSFEIDCKGIIWTCNDKNYINYPRYLFKSRKELLKLFFNINLKEAIK